MANTLYLGSFNAEAFWRDPCYASLPSFRDAQAEKIVEAMDEMQFVFCQDKGDQLLTSFALNNTHKDYLRDLGFNFECNGTDVRYNGQETSIFHCAPCDTACVNATAISPYAVLPGTIEFCGALGVKQRFPDMETVRKVNSKIFSSQLGESFTGTYSYIVNDAEQFYETGKELLGSAPIVVKDPFGVSGKGNLYIDQLQTLKRIAGFAGKQVNEGKKLLFVLERYLEKETDFSCQFFITDTGGAEILSVQQMENRQFSFDAIQNAGDDLLSFIRQRNYFTQVEEVAAALYSEGYFGPVCMDSMILKDGCVMPVIEINARKSMGLVNYYMNRYLSQFSVSGKLMTLQCVLSKPVSFDELFSAMQKHDLLFSRNKPEGIILLSANTFDINLRQGLPFPVKGRLYLSLIQDAEGNVAAIPEALFSDLGIKIIA